MHRWIRRACVLLVVVGLLMGAAIGTAWLLFRLYGPDLVRAELEDALSSAFGRPLASGPSRSVRGWLACESPA
jgi:hypothetical protein